MQNPVPLRRIRRQSESTEAPEAIRRLPPESGLHLLWMQTDVQIQRSYLPVHNRLHPPAHRPVSWRQDQFPTYSGDNAIQKIGAAQHYDGNYHHQNSTHFLVPLFSFIRLFLFRMRIEIEHEFLHFIYKKRPCSSKRTAEAEFSVVPLCLPQSLYGLSVLSVNNLSCNGEKTSQPTHRPISTALFSAGSSGVISRKNSLPSFTR